MKWRWGFSILMVLLSVLSIGPSVFAQNVNQEEANKALLLEWWEVEAAKDYYRMAEFFVEDVVRHSAATSAVMPPGFEINDLTTYQEFLRQTARMLPDYYMTPITLVAEGDLVSFYATFNGVFVESGNRISLPMMGIIRFEDGLMAELWVEWDNVSWNAQMTAPSAETTEAPITGIDDIVGTWRVYSEDYGWARFVIFTEQGIAYAGASRSCLPDDCFDRSEFAIEGDAVHFLTSEVYPDCAEATYTVYVVSQNGNPVGLRFDLVGDDCTVERVEAFARKTIYPVTQ